MKMLIVEDDSIERKILENAFRNDFEVFFAFDGNEAIDLLNIHNDFKIVLLDILMPKKNGYEVLSYIKNSKTLNKIPVIITTSINDVATTNNLISMGANDIISKPFDMRLVQTRVDNCIRASLYNDIVMNNSKNHISQNKENQSKTFYSSLTNMNFKLLDELNLTKFFDFYRIVDSNNYEMYFYNDNSLTLCGHKCYETWNGKSPCANCISKSCCQKNREYLKIESLDGRSYLIAAVPVKINNVTYSAELIKDITDTFMLLNQKISTNINMTDLFTAYDDAKSKDMFTTLYNKIYIDAFITKVLANKQNLGIAILDLNKFKEVNDTYGHLTGDDVILYFSSLLKKAARKNDLIVGRIGGDEFIVISINNIDLDKILINIRTTFSSHLFEKDKVQFKVDVAYGITYNNSDDTYVSLFNRADEEMYKFKRYLKEQSCSK